MDGFMKSILSRVLSEEIGNQRKWHEQEIQNGVPEEMTGRLDNIQRIKEFMEANDIEVRPDYF